MSEENICGPYVVTVTDVFGQRQDVFVHHVVRIQEATPGELAMGWGAKIYTTQWHSALTVRETREQIRDLMGLGDTEASEADEDFVPITGYWQHRARRSRYGLIGFAVVQHSGAGPIREGDEVAVYLSLGEAGDDGQMMLWARPRGEFLDGRFVEEDKH